MASIHLQSVCLEFPIYGINTRSLRKKLIRVSTGGMISTNENEIIYVRALHNLSLQINHGDRVGLIGHNGAGKSTLLRLLAHIYEPTLGVAQIDGKVTALLDVMLGMDSESTGYENIFLRSILHGLTKKQINTQVEEIAEFSGLGDYLKMPVRTYSTGMQLRLAFAIATNISPEILILDEVVGAGDITFIQKAKARMNAMINQSHIVLIASHDTALLASLCNKILWLEAGKMIYFGTEVQKTIQDYENAMNQEITLPQIQCEEAIS